MKALIQRVALARVDIEGKTVGAIERGLLVFVCGEPGDTEGDLAFLARKMIALRIFSDADGKMNLALNDVGGSILAVSQFTLATRWRKGNRPGFTDAAPPDEGERLFETFVAALRTEGAKVATERRVAQRYDLENLGTLPEIADWRHAYRDFGIKQTKYRSSVERRLRSAVKGRGLPRISRPVDAYNLISLRYLVPIGADDLGFGFAQGGESFMPLGKMGQGENPPKPGEVIYADQEKVLCRRWNWYQDGRSYITATTTRAVVTIQSLGNTDVETAAAEFDRLWRTACGARTVWQVADADLPELDFEALA